MSALARAGQRIAEELLAFDAPLTAGERVVFRIYEVLVAAWTLEAVWRWVPYLGRSEDVLVPVGAARYLDVSILFDTNVAAAMAAAITVALGLGLFRKSRWAYAVALVGFHLMYVSRYCLGKVGHGTHFVGVALLGLALATAMYRRAEQPIARFTFGFALFFYGVGYTSAAVCKLVATGVQWPAGSHLALWVHERAVDVRSTYGTFGLNPVQQAVLRSPTLATAALAFGLLSELCAALLWFRRTRPYLATALIAMHVGVQVTMNIWFGRNIYLLALVGYPWGLWLDRWWARHPLTRPSRARVLSATERREGRSGSRPTPRGSG